MLTRARTRHAHTHGLKVFASEYIAHVYAAQYSVNALKYYASKFNSIVYVQRHPDTRAPCDTALHCSMPMTHIQP